MIIKVCGMRDPGNMMKVLQLKPDWMGFILYSGSSRYVNEGALSSWVQSHLDLFEETKRVGVFVDATPEYVVRMVHDLSLHGIQLHGNETIEYGVQLRRQLESAGSPCDFILKAFGVDEGFDFEVCTPWEGLADYFIFDTKDVHYGGSGNKFEWRILDKYRGSRPFLLAGGIGPQDRDLCAQVTHSKWVGVDINSRFEHAPGVKSVEEVKHFIQYYRN